MDGDLKAHESAPQEGVLEYTVLNDYVVHSQHLSTHICESSLKGIHMYIDT
jgi:hypothetical protein